MTMIKKTTAPDRGVTNAVHTGQPYKGFPNMYAAGTCIVRAKGATTENRIFNGFG